MLVSDIAKRLEDLEESIDNLKISVDLQMEDENIDEAEKNFIKLKGKINEKNVLLKTKVEIVDEKRNIRT